MTTRQIKLSVRRMMHVSAVMQIALLILIWQAGEAVVHLLNLPVPGSVIGLFFVLALLATGRINVVSLRSGAKFLLAEMLLFFIPAVLAVLDHREFLGLLGLKIFAVILVGAIMVMVVTALAVDFSYRLMMRLGDHHARAR
ncbi:MAG TPA: CidA/LrgA family protein [Ensifer sp.]|nr:CidA/LrgA family protein [Ensifer sp.]